MTNEEAIKILRDTPIDLRSTREDDIHTLYATAQNMAIDALLAEAEQVTGKLKNPCDSLLTADSDTCKESKSKLDLISRQSALAEFRDGRDVYDIMESIEELPSAPDSRQRGEWVEIEDYNGDIHYQCDQCGEEFIFIDGTPKDNNYHFCPNCGADMRKGDNNGNGI